MIIYILNICGLFLDIIGATIIFIYGLNPSLKKHIAGTVNTYRIETAFESVKQEEVRNKKYDKISKIGLLFLVIGFILQLSGNIIGLYDLLTIKQ